MQWTDVMLWTQDIADPFFAYCKQHADKHSARLKRRNWLAVQSNMKNFENHFTDSDKVMYLMCGCVCSDKAWQALSIVVLYCLYQVISGLIYDNLKNNFMIIEQYVLEPHWRDKTPNSRLEASVLRLLYYSL